jgi:hypothetical protein
MAVTKLPTWLQLVLATAVLSGTIWLVIAVPSLGVAAAGLFSLLMLYVPFEIGAALFERVERLGRPIGQTRLGIDGVYVAETTTTRLGWWLAGLTSALLGALVVAWVAFSHGAVHLSW